MNNKWLVTAFLVALIFVFRGASMYVVAEHFSDGVVVPSSENATQCVVTLHPRTPEAASYDNCIIMAASKDGMPTMMVIMGDDDDEYIAVVDMRPYMQK